MSGPAELTLGRVEAGRLVLSQRDLVLLEKTLRVGRRASPVTWRDGEAVVLTGTVSERSRRDPDVRNRAWIRVRPDWPGGVLVVHVEVDDWKKRLPQIGTRVRARGRALSNDRFSWLLLNARLEILPEAAA